MPERTYHPEPRAASAARVGPKGSGRFEPVSWDEALDDIAARLKAIAGADGANAEAIVPYSYAGTMGLVQGESMAARFFNKLGASLLDRTICSSAGGEALAATYGAKVGMHVEHYAESRLIVIWGSNSITSNLHFWTYAQQAKRAGAKLICIDPRRTETAEKCHEHIALLPGTDGALALGVMHELIANDWLDHDYIDRHVDGWPALRERALQWPPERAAAVCGITAERGALAGARLRHDEAGGDPPQLRHAARARRRQRGAADRASCRAWSAPGAIAPAACCSRARAGSRRRATTPRCSGPTCSAGRRPRTINMSTIGDDLLRESGELLADGSPFGPRIEALVVYNSNPVAVAPRLGARSCAASRARTCSRSCSSTS